jgi:SAP domain-containing new25/Domain of unknown function (DUF6434)
MGRPKLSKKLAATEFLAWYWLKKELIDFCRSQGLPCSGSKPALTAIIAAFLQGEPWKVSGVRRPRGVMPNQFTVEMTIGEGWRCNPDLGRFMRSQCGPNFRFNAATRNFIHSGAGHQLSDAINCYLASVAPDAPRQEIIAQNEYNRHTREFTQSYPGAGREDILRAWWVRRGTKKSSP